MILFLAALCIPICASVQPYQSHQISQAELNRQLFTQLYRGDVEGVRELARTGADVSCYDTWGRQPLHTTYLTCNGKIVRTLLDCGAHIDARTKEKRMTPAHVFSIFKGDQPALHAVIECGADVSLEDAYGRTPLHIAADDNVEAVRLLLSIGADVNHRRNDGQTPLFTAICKGHNICIMKLLISEGADVNAKDSYLGETPFRQEIANYRTPNAFVDFLQYGGNISDVCAQELVEYKKRCAVSNDISIAKYIVALDIIPYLYDKSYLTQKDIERIMKNIPCDEQEQIALHTCIALGQGWWPALNTILRNYLSPFYYPELMQHAVDLYMQGRQGRSDLRAYIDDLSKSCSQNMLDQLISNQWFKGIMGEVAPHNIAYFMHHYPEFHACVRDETRKPAPYQSTCLHLAAQHYRLIDIIPLAAMGVIDNHYLSGRDSDNDTPVMKAQKNDNPWFSQVVWYLWKVRRILKHSNTLQHDASVDVPNFGTYPVPPELVRHIVSYIPGRMCLPFRLRRNNHVHHTADNTSE